MRLAVLLAAVAAALVLCGCGEDSLQENAGPVVSDIELTPAGARDFVLVGETGIFFRTAPATVDTPTLLQFTRFPSPVGLVAPIPEGFGFVSAAKLERVRVPEQTVLAAPVILRVPPSRPLPEGRRLLILIADNSDRLPVFRPLLDAGGRPAVGIVRSDGSCEFSVPRLGCFAVVADEHQP